MSRKCQVTGRGTTFGRSIARRGLAKSKGGVGQKITGVTRRDFKVNLHRKRIWVPELGRYVRVRLSARALKAVNRNGAFRTLLDAGLIKPPAAKKKKAS